MTDDNGHVGSWLDFCRYVIIQPHKKRVRRGARADLVSVVSAFSRVSNDVHLRAEITAALFTSALRLQEQETTEVSEGGEERALMDPPNLK